MEREQEGSEEKGTPKVNSHPGVRNPEKYPDCRTDLIGGGGITDVCPGRQTPSRRYCLGYRVDFRKRDVAAGS